MKRQRNLAGVALLVLAGLVLLGLVGLGVVTRPGEIATAGLAAGCLFAAATLEFTPGPDPVVFWGVVSLGGIALANGWL